LDATIAGIVVVAIAVALALTWVYARRRSWFRRAAIASILGMLAGIVVVLAIPLIGQPYD
jgi:hypothetical protein